MIEPMGRPAVVAASAPYSYPPWYDRRTGLMILPREPASDTGDSGRRGWGSLVREAGGAGSGRQAPTARAPFQARQLVDAHARSTGLTVAPTASTDEGPGYAQPLRRTARERMASMDLGGPTAVLPRAGEPESWHTGTSYLYVSRSANGGRGPRP